MSDTIIVAIITAGLALIGTVFTTKASNRNLAKDLGHQLDKQQAVMDTRLEELTREVREHNSFAQRIPVLEEQIKVINHRLNDLEKGA